MGISRERVGSIIHEDLDMRKLSVKWVPKCLNTRSKTSMVPVIWATFGILLARSKWFPVAIGDHGRNLVISQWPLDKATVMEWWHSGSPHPKKFQVQKFMVWNSRTWTCYIQEATVTHFY